MKQVPENPTQTVEMIGQMFMGTILLISVLAAVIRGGRFRQEIPGLMFPVAGLLLQRVTGFFFAGTLAGGAANILGYLLVLPFLWYNRRSLGLAVLTAGLFMNLAVIGANGGRMPVDPSAIAAAGVVAPPGELAKHHDMNEKTRLAILGDIIPITFPFRRVLSIGDLFIFGGLFLYVQEISGRPLLRRSTGAEPHSV